MSTVFSAISETVSGSETHVRVEDHGMHHDNPPPCCNREEVSGRQGVGTIKRTGATNHLVVFGVSML